MCDLLRSIVYSFADLIAPFSYNIVYETPE